MLTDKQIEREEAFCEDWYMTRKMEKTPTYADAIAWADKTRIEKARQWFNLHFRQVGTPREIIHDFESKEKMWKSFTQFMEEST